MTAIPLYVVAGQSNAVRIYDTGAFEAALDARNAGETSIVSAENGQSIYPSQQYNDFYPFDDGDENTGELYRALVAAINAELLANSEVYLAGVFWLQGEEDATDQTWGDAYLTNVNQLFLNLVALFGDGFDFVISALSTEIGAAAYQPGWDEVRLAQETMASTYDDVFLIDPDDLIDVAGYTAAQVFDDEYHYTRLGYDWLAESFFDLFPVDGNHPPSAYDDLFTTAEETAVSGNVLADNGNGADSDGEGDALTVDTTPLEGVVHGTLILNGDGSFSYTPDADFHGTDSFTYSVADIHGATDTATVTLTVTPVNDAPVLGPVTAYSLAENRTRVATLTASDVDGDNLGFAIVGGADAGLFALDPTTGVLRFVDLPDYEDPRDLGGDNVYDLTVEVTDGQGGSDSRALTIEVTDLTDNDPPVLWHLAADGNVTGLALGGIVADFAIGDTLRLEAGRIDLTSGAFTANSILFSIDIDGDGFAESAVTVPGTAFEVAASGGVTTVRLAGAGASQLTPTGERFITVDTGANRVYGDAGADVIATGGGADLVSAGAGDDVVLAGAGDDVILGGLGSDKLTGGTGADIFAFSPDDFAATGFTADFITDFTPGEDVIELAGFGITGLGDLAWVSLPAGNAIDLGAGRYIVLEGLSASDLGAGDIVGTDDPRSFALVSTARVHRLTEADDRFIAQESGAFEVFGGAGSDAIVGGANGDILHGEAGDDVLIGGGGGDRLIGGQGADRMTGGAGADSFEFTFGEETGFAAEVITDFEIGVDTLVLTGFGLTGPEDLVFSPIGAGSLALLVTGSRFVIFDGHTDAAPLEAAADLWTFA